MRKLPILLIINSLLFQASTLKGQQCFLDDRECEYYVQTSGLGTPIISYCDSIPCTGSLKIINGDGSYSVHQKLNGKNEGAGIDYYPDGQIKYLANYHANYRSGLVTKFYKNGRIESTEYFPPEHPGIWEGIAGQSFHPNGQLKEYWSYKLDPNWIPHFHYYFEENGDTLGKILPSPQDSSLFIETEYSEGKASNTRRYYIDKSGKRKYLSAASKVHSSDILHFWEAYDLIVAESDSLKQIAILDSLYLSRASIGLNKIREVRNYQAAEYIELINRYPKFWNSIRANTLKAPQLETELNNGIRDLQMLYPKLKPADIYFTIGAMRTNGTTQGNKVLIGSELAMGDSDIDLSEFEGRTKAWLENYFATEPIQNLVFLNIHEFVHTQQKAMPQSLLFISFYEGIAEYLAVQVTGKASPVPAINYGKTHPAVKKKFEAEMFEEKLYEWLWSNAPNEFDTRDLAYYIGYAIAEMYHLQSPDKAQALIDLIDLDYSKEIKVLQMIDQSGFFEKKILIQDTLSSLKDPEKYLGQYIYLKGELKQGDKFQLLGVAVDSSFLAVESSDYIAGGILLKIELEAADDNDASSLHAEYRLVSLFTGANAKAYPLKPN